MRVIVHQFDLHGSTWTFQSHWSSEQGLERLLVLSRFLMVHTMDFSLHFITPRTKVKIDQHDQHQPEKKLQDMSWGLTWTWDPDLEYNGTIKTDSLHAYKIEIIFLTDWAIPRDGFTFWVCKCGYTLVYYYINPLSPNLLKIHLEMEWVDLWQLLWLGGRSAGSYLADPTFPIPSHCAVIILLNVSRCINCCG